MDFQEEEEEGTTLFQPDQISNEFYGTPQATSKNFFQKVATRANHNNLLFY